MASGCKLGSDTYGQFVGLAPFISSFFHDRFHLDNLVERTACTDLDTDGKRRVSGNAVARAELEPEQGF